MGAVRLVPALVLLTILARLVTACSGGQLDDRYDRYVNHFGLALMDTGPHEGAILGRAVFADGVPAAWAKIYARRIPDADAAAAEPYNLTANDKGGFGIGRLQPGTYRLFVLAPGTDGTTLDVEVRAGEVSELASLTLAPLRRLSGHVRLDQEDLHTGTMVYVPGSPFSAMTDQDGYFYLDLPVGTYDLRAERDTYTPYVEEDVVLEADRTLEILLKPNPWPFGRVRVAGPHPYLVRGPVTRLRVSPVSGVRYMRLRHAAGTARLADVPAGSWIKVRPEVTVTTETDGASAVAFEFQDAYGKTSDPVYVQFYNTSLDDSWRFLYGTHRQAVRIRAGEKVALLGGYTLVLHASDSTAGDSASGVPVPADSEEQPDPSAPVPGGADPDAGGGGRDWDSDEDDGTSAFPGPPDSAGGEAGTFFAGEFTVEAGAQVRGGATFGGTLTVAGTAEAPVDWQPLTDRHGSFAPLELRAGASISHARMQRVTVNTGSTAGEVTIADSEFSQFDLSAYRPPYADAGGDFTLTLRRVRLSRGGVGLECPTWSADGSSDTPIPPNGRPVARLRLILEESTLHEAGLRLACLSLAQRREVTVELLRNDFLALADQQFHLGVPAAGLPDESALTWRVSDNHFQTVERLHHKVGEQGWPAWFGPNRPTAWGYVASELW